jgi:hypothetical protein
MKGLRTTILYALPVAPLLIILILFENFFEIYSPFVVTGESSMSDILTVPREPEPQSVSQSNTNNTSTNIATNPTNATGNGTEGIETTEDDIFGISKIYPTKVGGREWFLNMSDPKNSSNFFITENLNLSKLSDGSWRINSSHVRMVVNTSQGQEEWKNVEMTGYVRLSHLVNRNVSDADNSNNLRASSEDEIDDLVFISRSGGRHSSEVPCEGTAYNAGLHTDGSTGWKKEIWHTGGYTEERARNRIADSYLNKWVGLKAVVYNFIRDNETSGVKLEMYIDASNTNNYTKVSDITDRGGWYTKSNITEFFSAGCGRARDYVIIDGGPNVIFRTDNTVLDFKNLSVREIQPPPQLSTNTSLNNVFRLNIP